MLRISSELFGVVSSQTPNHYTLNPEPPNPEPLNPKLLNPLTPNPRPYTPKTLNLMIDPFKGALVDPFKEPSEEPLYPFKRTSIIRSL